MPNTTDTTDTLTPSTAPYRYFSAALLTFLVAACEPPADDCLDCGDTVEDASGQGHDLVTIVAITPGPPTNPTTPVDPISADEPEPGDTTAQAPIEGAVQVSTSNLHTCATFSNGTVECWGFNSIRGELGDGSTVGRNTPAAVLGIADAIGIDASGPGPCAVLATGQVQCWAGRPGTLGTGTLETSTTPVSADLFGATKVATALEHSCALLSSGEVKCWGYNRYGKCGAGSLTDYRYLTPQLVVGISNAVDVVAGQNHSCALLSTGEVQCWGENRMGQLGNGTNDTSATPVTVVGINNAIAITAGMGHHACAVLSDGKVKCWGYNPSRLLGEAVSATTQYQNTPVTIVGLSNAVAVAGGVIHNCALLWGGSVKCWGGAPLGDGTFSAPSPTPVPVMGISGAVSIDAGGQHSCAVLSNGDVKCWGINNDGQLGDGSYDDAAMPVTVAF